LQPMEESARLVFSRVDHDSKTLETVYTSCVKLVLYIGLCFSCLAVNYTQIFLTLLAGWGDNPEAVATLSAFCVYTAALAWNGMTEACMYGIAKTGKELQKVAMAHTVIAFVFVTLAPLAVIRGGTVALVWANTLSMIARALFAIYFAANSMKTAQEPSTLSIMLRLISKMIPPRLVMLCFVASYLATRTSKDVYELKAGMPWLQSVAQHVGVGAACGMGIVTVAYTVEKQLLGDLRRLGAGKQD
jgi:Rft protein